VKQTLKKLIRNPLVYNGKFDADGNLEEKAITKVKYSFKKKKRLRRSRYD